jgi:hypothetical protein
VKRVLRGVRVQRIKIKCLLGGVEGAVMNSSMRRKAIAKPRPLQSN